MTASDVEDSLAGFDQPLWTRALAAELLPDPALPLDRGLLWDGAALPAWRNLLVGRLGFRPDEVDPEQLGVATELLGFFGGYAYLNVSLLRVWAARMPVLAPNHIDAAYLGEHGDLPAYEAAAWHDHPEATLGPLNEWLAWVLVEQDQSDLVADREAVASVRLECPELSVLSDLEVFTYVLSLQPLCRRLFAQHLNQTLAASIGPGLVAAMCDEIGLPTYATKLLSALGGVDSVAGAEALWTLSRLVRGSAALSDSFEAGRSALERRLRSSDSVDVTAFMAGLDALVDEIGYLSPAQFQLQAPSWETDLDLALAAIDWLRTCPDSADPAIGLVARETERTTLIEEIGDVIGSGPTLTNGTTTATRDQFGAAISATAVFVRGRERSRSNLSRVLNEMRIALRELGERAVSRGDLNDPGDLHHLTVDELTYYADGGLAEVGVITTERRLDYQRLSISEPPFLIDGDQSPGVPVTVSSETRRPVVPMERGEILLAKPGSSEVIRGRARIVGDPSEAGVFEPGDVLVTRYATGGWMPYLIGIAALVIETGSVLSEATVACRELGVPVVVAARHATTQIPDGSIVEVDGLTGIVTVVEPPPTAEKASAEPPLDPWGVSDL